ncbi:MAG TPA: FAD-binding oxidoreductase [Thermomicrobiaceae bacterium]|nr:FAD-binding oxidoreductase [Thermomicrobiaceae bacterium]
MAIGSAYLRGASIAVIGAGAVGSVVGYRLAQAGAAVTIVEPRYPGAGTTGNSFAWLNAFGKPPRAYHRLNARSIRDHRDLARELDGDWAHVDGGLQWTYADDAAHGAHLKETVAQIRAWGYRVETVTPEQVMRELEPDLVIDPDRVAEVYYMPGEGWLNGVGLAHGAALAAVRRYGATLLDDEVVGFDLARGGVERVLLRSGGTLTADTVVNAAGPNAARVAALAGADLPIERQPGFVVTTEPAPVALKRVVHSPEGMIRSDGGWRVLLRRDEFDEHVADEQSFDVRNPYCQEAVDRFAAILPGLRGVRAESARLGIRPMPKDGYSIVGFDPEVTGLYHVVTHSGITLSAALGLLVTEDLLGEAPRDLEPFRPARFSEGDRLAYGASDE